MNTKLVIQILIGLTGYCVWGAIALHDPAQMPDFLKFNIAMAAGTIGLVLRDMQQPTANSTPAQPAPTVVTKEAP